MEAYALHFNAKFQAGLLVLLLTDFTFFKSVIDELSPSHLDAGESYIKLYKLIKKQWDLNKKPLSIDITKNVIRKLEESKLLSSGDSNGLYSIIELGQALLPNEYDYIKNNVYDFLKKQVVTLAFSNALEYFDKADYDTMYNIISGAVKKSFEVGTLLGSNWLETSIEDLYSESPRPNIWSSGFPKLDSFLEGGGYASSECYTVLSPSGRGKCHGIDTPILLYDGSIKLVQDIIPGDKLLGPDGKSRNVLSITSGKDNLYKIIPKKGIPYVVNSEHLLSLKKLNDKKNIILPNKSLIDKDDKNPFFIKAETLFNASETFKSRVKGWRPEAVSFENEINNHQIPPYILGIWLGDGTSASPQITQVSNEVSEEFERYAKNLGAIVTKHKDKRSKAITFRFTNNKKKNIFKSLLKEYNLLNNKHIPKQYIFTSISNRLELLAGLIDTDGSLKNDKVGYEIIQKNKELTDSIVFMCRSLGLYVNISKCTKKIKSLNFSGKYYRITISGNTSIIPCRIKYKKAKKRKQIKNHLYSGLTIEKYGYGDYFGFEIDGDKQYLLSDWQVTHNTSWLCNTSISAVKANKKIAFITLELSEKTIQRRHDSILSGFSSYELSNSKEAQVELFNLKEQFKNSLPIIKEFSRGTLSLTNLDTYLERYTLEYGKPDVIILDWLGCLKLPTNGDKKHEQLAEAADHLVNLSREYDATVITAHQTNRSAVANDLFNYSAISESFSSIFGMDLVLGLGATDKSKDAGRRTLNILKSRMGPDSVYVNLMGDLPGKPLTFKFRELSDSEADLLSEVKNDS